VLELLARALGVCVDQRFSREEEKISGEEETTACRRLKSEETKIRIKGLKS
jgi:hypothetical protein